MQKIKQIICGLFYHRFGYSSDRCVRCGMHWCDATPTEFTGRIISNEYDREDPDDDGKHNIK